MLKASRLEEILDAGTEFLIFDNAVPLSGVNEPSPTCRQLAELNALPESEQQARAEIAQLRAALASASMAFHVTTIDEILRWTSVAQDSVVELAGELPVSRGSQGVGGAGEVLSALGLSACDKALLFDRQSGTLHQLR